MRAKPSRFRRILRVRVRRLMARLDRRAAVILAWVPSWGTSLLLHAALLLLLGLYAYARSSWGQRDAAIQSQFGPGSQLRDNVVSVLPADHAGDPFTRERKADSPSMSIERAEPDVTLVAQPEIPRLSHFAPVIAGPEPGVAVPGAIGAKARGSGKGGTIAPQSHSEDISAPFAGRSPDMKAILLRREGGTAQSEMAVDAGLDWLARHQKVDGGWSLDVQAQCQGDGCPVRPALESDTAATGLALLPLLGAGHVHTVKSRYQANIRRGLDWLIEHQDRAGDLYVGGARNAHLYSHAIGAMALCEAYGLSQDERLREPASRAIRFIIDAQNTQTGGWRYEPGDAGDTSVFGWQMFALRSARLSGLQVPRNVLKGCKAYLDEAATDSSRVTYAYQPGQGGTYVMTAEALLARQYLGWPRDFPALVKGVAHVAEDLKTSPKRNIYYWYYATQLLHNMHTKEWPRWNVKLREALIRTQVNGNGCDRGSWDPLVPQPDQWGQSAGRLYETALSLLTLEVYYRYLPLYRETDRDPPEKNAEGPGDAKGGFQPVPAGK